MLSAGIVGTDLVLMTARMGGAHVSRLGIGAIDSMDSHRLII